MDALLIIQAVIGLAFALFIPGYLIVLLAFRDLTRIEQIALAIGLSIMVDIMLGIFLGYNKHAAAVTGGINAYNVWFYMITLTTGLAIAVIVKYFIRGKNGTGNKEIFKT